MNVAKSIAMMCFSVREVSDLFSLLYKYSIIERKGQGFYCQENVKGFVKSLAQGRALGR